MKRKKKGLVATLSNEESSSGSNYENFGSTLIKSIVESIKEESSTISEKEEAKTTRPELEEMLSIWEENLEVLKCQ